ncbi:DUF3261 domain-containing protein [Agarivorans sp. JK6]|uniref:DUF3261 domain-containing protein n=1 Tax=Agarivorans sp. JK6 TaxID=2997426 RepID=UPI003873106D
MIKVVLLGLLVFLTGCSINTPPTSNISRDLLAPAELGESVAVEQLVSFAFNEKKQQMLVHMDIKPYALELLAFDGFSTPLFKLEYDGKKLVKENYIPLVDDGIAKRILADMQLVYWPVPRLNQQLASGGWMVEQTICQQGLSCRKLYLDDELVAVVLYQSDKQWHSDVSINNLTANYQIEISTLKVHHHE